MLYCPFRLFLALALVGMVTASPFRSLAQNLHVFQVDASGYPIIKAKLYAFDTAGVQQRPAAGDVTVTENGIQRTVNSNSCPEAAPPKTLSSVLVIDVSGSMAEGETGVPNIDLAKAAATEWTKSVGIGQNECAIVSFDGQSYFNQDYTNNRKKLLATIDSLAPNDGTNYDAALLLPVAGGLQVAQNAKHQRMIVMLTDGLPNFEPQTSAIIAEAQRQNCLVYAVTVGLPCPQCLKDICEQTGGKWFENVVTTKQTTDVYNEILQLASNGLPSCEITWTSGPVCSADPVTVIATWSGVSDTTYYQPPRSQVADLKFSPYSIFLRGKPVNQTFDTTVTIVASNASFSVTNITSTNAEYDISPKSFSLSAGDSVTLTIRFTPLDSSYSWTSFDFQTNLCMKSYYASAGYPGSLQRPSLELVRPNGGEVLVAGSDTVIQWHGVPQTDSVIVEYSIDSGKTWRPITGRATGGSFPWHVPTVQSSQCLVRLTQAVGQDMFDSSGWTVTPQSLFWADGQSIAVDPYGCVYLVGKFSGELDFGGVKVHGVGHCNVFVLKVDPNGQPLWAKGISGGDSILNEDHTITSVSVDSNGNLYLAGALVDTMDFGGVKLNGQTNQGFPDGWSSFIAKYDGDGSLSWAKKTGPLGSGTGVSISQIAVSKFGGVFITGFIYTQAILDKDTLVKAGAGANPFVAKFSTDGHLLWLKATSGSPSGGGFGEGISVDADSNVYVSGAAHESVLFDSTQFYSNGNFLAAFNSSGQGLWVMADGFNATFGTASGHQTAIAQSGSIWQAGYFTDSIDIGGHTYRADSNSHYFNSYLTRNEYIAEYTPRGSASLVARASGVSNDSYLSVAPLNNGIFVVGVFEDTIEFGHSRIVRGLSHYSEIQNGFIEKSSLAGDFEWAEVLYDPKPLRNATVVSDRFGNIYVTGTIIDTSVPGHDATEHPFLWKRCTSFQSEISDSAFSIVIPQPAAHDVDMGRLFLGDTKDSVVLQYVQNLGAYPFRVDSIVITGADAADFGLVSGLPPFDVPANGNHKVEFRFRPSVPGVRTATVLIYTQSDTLVQTIRGRGDSPDLAMAANIIDFGPTPLGSSRDTTLSVALRNNGNVAISFIGESQLGPDTKQFSLQSGGGAFTLQPGAAKSIDVRYSPRTIGRRSGRIAFERAGAAPAIFTVFGDGLGGAVAVANDSGYAGDSVSIPLTLQGIDPIRVPSAVKGFTARIAYDRSVLAPHAGAVQRGPEYDTVTLPGIFLNDSLLMRMPFTVLAGSQPTSPVGVVDFSWADRSGSAVSFDVESQNATFHLLGSTTNKPPSSSPDDVTIVVSEIGTDLSSLVVKVSHQKASSESAQITIANVLGMVVTTVFDGELPSGEQTFTIPTSSFALGVYFVTVKTPTIRKTEHFTLFR